MSTIPDASILIQDLLSPRTTQLDSTTPALIAYHLSTLTLSPATVLTTLVQCIATSPSLWRGQATYSNGNSWQPLNYPRAKEVYEALRNGVLYRAGEISRGMGTGWRARRKFAQFLEGYYAGIDDSIIHPQVCLILASAALGGLQLVKQRKDKLFVGGSTLLGRAETEALAAWEGYFAAEKGDEVGGWSGTARGEFEIAVARLSSFRILRPNHSCSTCADDEPTLTTWIASETLSTISVDSLKSGPLVVRSSLHRARSLTEARRRHYSRYSRRHSLRPSPPVISSTRSAPISQKRQLDYTGTSPPFRTPSSPLSLSRHSSALSDRYQELSAVASTPQGKMEERKKSAL